METSLVTREDDFQTNVRPCLDHPTPLWRDEVWGFHRAEKALWSYCILPYNMPKTNRWIHLGLEGIGILAITAGLIRLVFYLFLVLPFRNFTDGNCHTTEEITKTSPNGRHTIRIVSSQCGPFSHYFVYLKTGNDNKGFEETAIVWLRNNGSLTATARWNGDDQLSVQYSQPAEIMDAYQRTLGVDVLLDPTLRTFPSP